MILSNMFITLYGPDSWRRKEKKEEIIAEFKKKHLGSSVGFFDLAEEENISSFSNFINFINNQSIFEPAKLVVLENVFDREELASQIKPLSKPRVVILISSDEKPTGEWSFLLESPNQYQEFSFLKGKSWEAFVKKQANRMGVKLSQSVLDFFVQHFKEDSWRLVTELQKLSNLSKKIIEKEDLENLSLEATPVFWDLAIKLKSLRVSERLMALEKFFSINEPPAKIFNVISSFWQEKSSVLAEHDLAVKSGKIDYEEALLDLVL